MDLFKKGLCPCRGRGSSRLVMGCLECLLAYVCLCLARATAPLPTRPVVEDHHKEKPQKQQPVEGGLGLGRRKGDDVLLAAAKQRVRAHTHAAAIAESAPARIAGSPPQLTSSHACCRRWGPCRRRAGLDAPAWTARSPHPPPRPRWADDVAW